VRKLCSCVVFSSPILGFFILTLLFLLFFLRRRRHTATAAAAAAHFLLVSARLFLVLGLGRCLLGKEKFPAPREKGPLAEKDERSKRGENQDVSMYLVSFFFRFRNIPGVVNGPSIPGQIFADSPLFLSLLLFFVLSPLFLSQIKSGDF